MDSLDIDSKFRLAILAAKRAKQLVHGSKKKLDIDAENPLTVAIEEINQGKINFHILEEDEMLQQQQMFLSREDDEDEISDEDLLEGLKDMMGPREDDNDDDEDDEDEDDDEDDEDDSDAEDDDDVDEDETDDEDEDDEE